jgi:DNA replicative helicase MCM subunit Mcm2 (Cdc46/Mcm family)
MANGFANRILFCLVRRSKELPFGGHVDDATVERIAERFKRAVEFAKKAGRVVMTDSAAQAWAEAYGELSAERPGLLGAVTARAEAQVIRLSLIFALLDGKDLIDTAHLGAAMAVWSYCDQSAYLIFGDNLGDPVADDILSALRRSSDGMTRTTISHLFGRHRTSDQIGAALAKLHRLGLARFGDRETGGRAAETWFATGGPR